jgi:diguanylate cyclase (GGDEF)-like protein
VSKSSFDEAGSAAVATLPDELTIFCGWFRTGQCRLIVRKASCLLAFIAIILPALGSTQGAKRGVLLVTSAGPAHDLPPELSRHARVYLVGTVTYYDPAEGALFLQDATGGIFINIDKTYPLHQGDLIEVDGKTDSSYRSEVAFDPNIRVLGPGKTFEAERTTYRVLASGKKDCRLVSIRGRVRAVDIGYHPNAPSGHIDLVVPGGEMEVYIHSPSGMNAQSLLDAEVEVTGVAGGSFDAKWQMTGVILYAQDSSAIHILQAPALSAGKLPLTDINELLETRSVQDKSERVRVRGTVTYYRKGYAAVLESKGKSIYVQTRQTGDLAIGDVADAFGFASETGYAPGLHEAAILKTGSREEVVPRVVSYAAAMSGSYSDNLISLSGSLVSELHDTGTDTIVLDVDGHLVSAYLEGSAPLKSFLPGSQLRIAGICRVMPGNPWQAPYVFHLDLRDAADVQLLSRPSWWTIPHLVELLGALAFSAVALATWTMILKKRVLRQSGRIQRSMTVACERTRILEMISSNQTPDLVLSEMCKSVMALLPGAKCSYYLHPLKGEPGYEQIEHALPIANCLFEMALTGPEGETLGGIVVSCFNPSFSVADQQEVYSILNELATLAIRQSLLYQGLLHHSTHDSLTELPNRRLCDSKLATALEEAALQGGQLAVIYIDVNRFKQVNDKYGHKVGDSYLKDISGRLLSQIRPTDTLARIGGDEFLVIAPFCGGFDQTSVITVRLQACFDDPFYVEGEYIEGSASFGIAVYPQHGVTAEDLKRNADHAMYLAKRNDAGRADSPTDIAIVTADELSTALQKDLFRLVYQPQFSASGRLTGLEVLLRLEDPTLGTLSPDAFISVAERSDVILEIGAWVLRQALQDAMRWQLHKGNEISVAINVSVRQITQPDFANSVFTCLKEYGFPAERLEIELVERSLLAGSGEVAQQLERLHQAGVRISLDDFGTGQSCLSILHKLPIDTIKLDRSFILAMEDEPKVLPIVRAIALMATSLGKRIVAEGIEHVGPVPTLLEMADMEFQGHLLSRPVPAQEVDRLIDAWRSGIDMPAAFRALLR